MMLDIRNALERLCSQTAPSGFEAPAAQAAMELLRPLVDEVSIDRLGNLVGVRRCGKPGCLTPIWTRSALLLSGLKTAFYVSAALAGSTPGCCPTGS